MPVLRILHSVRDFEGWKRAFDNDPIDRRGSGVRQYHVLRAVDDPHMVMIDLEFDTLPEAQEMLLKLKRLWAGPGGAVMKNPMAWIVERIESVAL